MPPMGVTKSVRSRPRSCSLPNLSLNKPKSSQERFRNLKNNLSQFILETQDELKLLEDSRLKVVYLMEQIENSWERSYKPTNAEINDLYRVQHEIVGKLVTNSRGVGEMLKMCREMLDEVAELCIELKKGKRGSVRAEELGKALTVVAETVSSGSSGSNKDSTPEVGDDNDSSNSDQETDHSKKTYLATPRPKLPKLTRQIRRYKQSLDTMMEHHQDIEVEVQLVKGNCHALINRVL